MTFIVSILGALCVAIIADEFLAWSSRLSIFLIRRSVRSLPPHYRERLYEEWLGDMQTYPGKLSRLIFALDTFRAAYRIGHSTRLPHLSRWLPVLVRTADLLLATAVLLIDLPVILLISLAILIATRGRGPILHRDTHIGLDSQPFQLLKFRLTSSDSVNGMRLSKLGRFVRYLRLHEIPQLLNVIRGDMSLVGPRPERSKFVAFMSTTIPGYEARHRVRPGITGDAQVRHPDGASAEDAKEKLRCDLYYIEKYSFGFYIKVLIRTFWIVIRGL